MAVNNSVKKYSRRFMLNFFMMIFLAWFILLGWAMGLWAFFSFDVAWNHLNQLAIQQISHVHWPIPTHLSAVTDALQVQKNILLPEMTLFKVPEFTLEIQDILKILEQFWLIIQLTTYVLFNKLTLLFTALPLFALTMTAGLVDGLNQRAIRTASLGRESSYVFHRLNRLFKCGLTLLLALWLVLPIPITPAYLFIPSSIVLGLMVSMTTSRFKKYL